MKDRIYLFDSTLRDGAQTRGIDFSVADKVFISNIMDDLGIDYIEGGWPGANPTDDEFFQTPLPLKQSKLCAFGMTQKNASELLSQNYEALREKGVKALCLVGKSWDFQVETALSISLKENIELIQSSIRFASENFPEVIFDAEHFFDGYKENSQYSVECLKAAYESGARWVALCDTNGGTLPHEVEEIVAEVTKSIPGKNIGIHCHNDTGNAIANSLMAVRSGARQIQGTLNGFGERCGNANLVSIIPTLILKMGYQTQISEEQLKSLTHISNMVSERLNRSPVEQDPYVGKAAFAHKGGLHASGIAKDKKCYEHIDPELVGNQRQILLSNQSGKANLLTRCHQMGFDIEKSDSRLDVLVEKIKDLEYQGYSYDSAEASFEVLIYRLFDKMPELFKLNRFRVIDDRRWSAKGELITESEATVSLEVDGESKMTVAHGNGPVNALDRCIRKALVDKYPILSEMQLVDYKVRILNHVGTKSIVRVIIESEIEGKGRWSTVGLSTNIIDASYEALHDSLAYSIVKFQ